MRANALSLTLLVDLSFLSDSTTIGAGRYLPPLPAALRNQRSFPVGH